MTNPNANQQPVQAYNEWDPLEEVIVGRLDFATIPEWHLQLESTMPEQWESLYKQHGGELFSREQIEAGQRDLEGFVKVLEAEGVTVRRPDAVRFNKPFSTLHWGVKGGLYAAMPRDYLMVIGDELIESPMSWRSRYHEGDAYKTLMKEYFQAGAKWTQAPKPQLLDELYNDAYHEPIEGGEPVYSITEFEPVFDAADFMRCGRDIFVQLSNVTNQFGVDWLQRHLGDTYKIHVLDVNDSHPMHIDATFCPIAPGKLFINKHRFTKIPEMFKDWEILEAPEPNIPTTHPLYMTSRWLNVNILMLDEKRVIVEAGETDTIEAFRRWGFTPIPVSFRNFNTFGGSFHCATTDVRRRGDLKSYF